MQADGKILAGGSFNGANSIGGQARNYIARLDATTGAADSFNPNANGAVESIAVQADGKILAGGFFNGANSIGGATRNYVARLDPATGSADLFNSNANDFILSIALQADGKILAGGQFTALAPNGGTTDSRNRIARLETDGRVDRTLNLSPFGVGTYVLATALQPDGKILIGGKFTTVLGSTRNNIARLNTDGTLDTAFNPNANDVVRTIVVQADGKILVGGDFSSIASLVRNNIARLNLITGLPDSFNPNANSTVYAIAVQADGKILVGGLFNGANSIGGQTRNYIARLDATTGLADSFNPNASNIVYSIAVQPDGKILAGGFFTSIAGLVRNYIARINPITGLADSFNPNADGLVDGITVQADGRILVYGEFIVIGGQVRRHIVRLNATTGAADSFNPNANFPVYCIAEQADGKILAGGSFTTIGGQTRNYIARLNATTGLADSFNPDASGATDPYVYAIAVQADAKILAGGGFSSIGGQPRSRFARLSNDTAARQNLAITQTAVTWTRSGASPQFMRVTFESSTDNVNYAVLGNGTAAGGNWTLTGLNLPTGQNIYIRARGFYRGSFSGSESITESVRNAFIALLPTPTQVVSRKVHSGAPFDIPLPLTGNSGIECRSGGATNDYQVIFTFANSVTFSGAALTTGAGAVSGSSGSGTISATVNLTGVTNAQRITVTLQGVNGSGDVSVPMGILVGDTNADGFVNAGDSIQTRNRSGQGADSANFRSDVNADGIVNSGDTTIVRSRSGTFLP